MLLLIWQPHSVSPHGEFGCTTASPGDTPIATATASHSQTLSTVADMPKTPLQPIHFFMRPRSQRENGRTGERENGRTGERENKPNSMRGILSEAYVTLIIQHVNPTLRFLNRNRIVSLAFCRCSICRTRFFAAVIQLMILCPLLVAECKFS
jgi:hypothetical protein